MSFYGFLIYDLLIFSRQNNEYNKNKLIKNYIEEKNKNFLFFTSTNAIKRISSIPNIEIDSKLNYIYFDNKRIHLDANNAETIGFFIPMIVTKKDQ